MLWKRVVFSLQHSVNVCFTMSWQAQHFVTWRVAVLMNCSATAGKMRRCELLDKWRKRRTIHIF